MYNPLQKDKLDLTCKHFQHFAKQITPILKTMLTSIANFMQNKSQSISNYKDMLLMFDKYEELNLLNYVDGRKDKMVFGNKDENSSTGEVVESMNKLVSNLKNPYFNLYHWCKGELFDIEAISSALKKKDEFQAKIGSNEKKKKTTQGDLDNLTQGKSTMK